MAPLHFGRIDVESSLNYADCGECEVARRFLGQVQWRQKMKRTPWYALLMLLAGSSYGLVSTLMKSSYNHGFVVADVTNAQYLFAVLTLWPIALFWRRKKRISQKQWALLAVIGLAGAGTSFTYYLSLTQLPASLGIVLLFQFAWMVLLIDIAVTRRIPTLEKWIGVAMIVVGTLLAVGLFASHLGQVPMGAVALGLCSAVFYALTLYLSEFVDPDSSPALRSALTVTISGIAMVAVFSPVHLYTVSLWHGLWKWGLLVALFSQTFPVLLMYIAIPRIGGRMAGVLGSIELPVAVLVAHLALGEVVSLVRWFGVVLILAGIAVSELVVLRHRPRNGAPTH